MKWPCQVLFQVSVQISHLYSCYDTVLQELCVFAQNDSAMQRFCSPVVDWWLRLLQTVVMSFCYNLMICRLLYVLTGSLCYSARTGQPKQPWLQKRACWPNQTLLGATIIYAALHTITGVHVHVLNLKANGGAWPLIIILVFNSRQVSFE